MTRDELIDAGAQAIASVEDMLRDDEWEGCLALAEDVLDAVEPLIRADERERTGTVGGHRQIRDEGRADMCADLRAQVEALEDEHVYDPRLGSCVLRADVLALIDGDGGE